MRRKDIVPVVIPLSRMKMTLLFLGAVAIGVLGLILLIYEPESINHSNRFSWIMKPVPRFLAGFFCVMFSGFSAITMLFRLFNKKPGLIINEKGIYDNSTAVALGFISWKDITEVKKITVNHSSFILIVVRNPIDYLNKTTQWLKLRALKMNFRYYDTPICISAHSLQIKFDELYKLLVDNLDQSKRN
ncbi:hypothetical protein CHRY9390_01274 [Chryseobacterium aquaeductus]|uniref:Uncharacterized protein n=1 Tax=Chryseobacterium aquaeductus TaxID=2675056 RepID=A0A9N8MG77_9FLAO|nr:STM3941 family protein [Chryseobacterium aquaeductus]CAA7330603.1 hypothetical protein CHRY9390_01274 [Chryseobacterium potabilaquae]CAD7804790.1 hypothetical protein CHRY9390_01274 [Chryseobacterium aquaeductus]